MKTIRRWSRRTVLAGKRTKLLAEMLNDCSHPDPWLLGEIASCFSVGGRSRIHGSFPAESAMPDLVQTWLWQNAKEIHHNVISRHRRAVDTDGRGGEVAFLGRGGEALGPRPFHGTRGIGHVGLWIPIQRLGSETDRQDKTCGWLQWGIHQPGCWMPQEDGSHGSGSHCQLMQFVARTLVRPPVGREILRHCRTRSQMWCLRRNVLWTRLCVQTVCNPWRWCTFLSDLHQRRTWPALHCAPSWYPSRKRGSQWYADDSPCVVMYRLWRNTLQCTFEGLTKGPKRNVLSLDALWNRGN